MTVTKLPVERWESVADLARWLLTHADEYEVAIVCARTRRRKAGDTENVIRTFTCPPVPVVKAVGILHVCAHYYLHIND
jgi:hypothetical protein